MPGWLKWGGIGCLGLIALVFVLPFLGSMFANSFWTFVVSFVLMVTLVLVMDRGEEGQDTELPEGGSQQSHEGQPSGFTLTVFGILFVAVLVFGVTATGKAIGRAVTGGPETASEQVAETTPEETTTEETTVAPKQRTERQPATEETKEEPKEESNPEKDAEREENNQQEQEEQAAAQPEPEPKPEPKPEPPPPEPTPEEKLAERGTVVTVSRAVDGDTVEVSPAVDGIEDVRLIGVDTPELSSDCGTQPLADEATVFAESNLVGQEVALEVGEESVDRYGRLLAYAWTEPDSMFNTALLREGLAQVYTVPPNDEYEARFYGAQQQAVNAGLGIWGLPYEQQVLQNDRGSGIGGGCVAAPPEPELAPQPAPEPTPQPAPEPAPSGTAPHPPPPDVDCSDFPAIGNPQDWYFGDDPHGLDRDGDGDACEPG